MREITREYKFLTEGILSLVEKEENRYRADQPEFLKSRDPAGEYELAMRELEREEMRLISMR